MGKAWWWGLGGAVLLGGAGSLLTLALPSSSQTIGVRCGWVALRVAAQVSGPLRTSRGLLLGQDSKPEVDGNEQPCAGPNP